MLQLIYSDVLYIFLGSDCFLLTYMATSESHNLLALTALFRSCYAAIISRPFR